MRQILIVFLLFSFHVAIFAQGNFKEAYPDSLQNKRLYTVVGIGTTTYISGLSFLSYIWYADQLPVDFHLYDDSKGYLQMDKGGHSFSAYRESYATYNALRWAGLNKKYALLFGGPFGFLLQTPIEIYDGKYENWGFSWSDMAANTFGSSLFTLQEALFDDQIVLMKFSYSPSIYPDYHSHLGVTEIQSFFLDYNAHTYWFSANIKKISQIEKMPTWLNFAFGYSANGMIYEFENPTYYQGKPFPKLERYRQYIFSLDVDFTKISTKKRWLQKVFRAINILKVPFPAIEINKVDGIKFHSIYF